jgi:hypothetical protein
MKTTKQAPTKWTDNRPIKTSAINRYAEPELMRDRIKPEYGPLAARYLNSPHKYDSWQDARATEAILCKIHCEGADTDKFGKRLCEARNAIYMRQLFLSELRSLLQRLPEPTRSELFAMLSPDIRQALKK